MCSVGANDVCFDQRLSVGSQQPELLDFFFESKKGQLTSDRRVHLELVDAVMQCSDSSLHQ